METGKMKGLNHEFVKAATLTEFLRLLFVHR